VPSGVEPPVVGETQTISYTADTTTDFLNPERGWMNRGTGSTLANARVPKGPPYTGESGQHPIGYSVVWSDPWGTPFSGSSGNPFRLDNYSSQNLPAALLTRLGQEFDAARSAGVKMKIRFTYNYGSSGQDTTRAWMQTHISQLAPVINAHADVIATMDAGFIGRWGEWNGSTGANSQSDRVAVFNSVINATPDWMTIGIRAPLHALEIIPSYNMPTSERFTGTLRSRMGSYNDCFMSDKTNSGTYRYDQGELTGDTERDVFMKISRFAAATGETCDNGGLNNYNTGSAAITEMGLMHTDVLFRQFWPSIYDRWQDTGQYDDISRRLGYRLVLREVTLPTAVAPSQAFNVTLEVRNDGFGKVYNPRPIDLVLVGSTTRVIRLTADARVDLPVGGETATAVYTATLPGDVPTGVYDMYLALPDPAPALADDPRYSIRLANVGVWEGVHGYNNLNATLTVEVEGSTP